MEQMLAHRSLLPFPLTSKIWGLSPADVDEVPSIVEKAGIGGGMQANY
jgi:hypothetical protein